MIGVQRLGPSLRHLVALALTLACAHAGAQGTSLERIQLASSPEPTLVAHWWPAAGAGAHPAVIGLHGCGGLYKRQGELSERFREYAEHWHAQGYSVLLPDSWTTHAHQRVCQTPYDQRHRFSAERQADVRAAVAWLRTRTDVDAARIALVGWSNGASTALRAIDPARGPVPRLASVRQEHQLFGGSHNSIGLPSGSWMRAKRPTAGSSHSSLVMISSPASRNGTSAASRSSTRRFSICWRSAGK